jgi:hypothetical protein
VIHISRISMVNKNLTIRATHGNASNRSKRSLIWVKAPKNQNWHTAPFQNNVTIYHLIIDSITLSSLEVTHCLKCLICVMSSNLRSQMSLGIFQKEA